MASEELGEGMRSCGDLLPYPHGQGCGAAASSQPSPAAAVRLPGPSPSPPSAGDNLRHCLSLLPGWQLAEMDAAWLVSLSLLRENRIQTFCLLVQ